MRITVSYRVRDTYDVPDGKWREAVLLSGNDEYDAVDSLMEKDELDGYLIRSDVTDWYADTGE
jgi:hypothetical protein